MDACDPWYPEIFSTYTLPASSSLSISMSTWSSCFASILLLSRQAPSVSLQETNTSFMFGRFFSLPSETLLFVGKTDRQDCCQIHGSINASIYGGYSVSVFAGDLCWWIVLAQTLTWFLGLPVPFPWPCYRAIGGFSGRLKCESSLQTSEAELYQCCPKSVLSFAFELENTTNNET